MSLAHQSPPPEPVAGLYETDYARWLFESARLLRAGRFSEADIANIAEELEDMGRSEYRAVASHMGVLLLHLLKWEYQPEHRSSSWRGSIFNARRAIAKRSQESPSLRRRLAEAMAEEYSDARYNAANETGLPEGAFPADCAYSVEDALDPDFWPGAA